MRIITSALLCAALAVLAFATSQWCLANPPSTSPTTRPDAKNVPIKIADGHDTDQRDGGRPVILIAAALKVPDEVFREAFTHVHPAKGRGPTGDEARKNKDALLGALGKYGVTNDRLDEVSNYYRYRPQEGELWTHKDAKGTANIENGKVVSITITDAGAGYSSVPTISVPGYPKVSLIAKIAYGEDLKTNGKIEAIKIVDTKK